MKPIHYLGLAVRLFAICLFIYGVIGIIEFLTLRLNEMTSFKPGFVSMIIMLIPIITSVFLWFFPLTVAYKLLGKEDKEFEPVNPKSLLTIFVASIGLFFLYKSLMDGAFWLAFYAMSSSGSSEIMTPSQVSTLLAMDVSDKAAIISTLVELIVALLLVVKCRSIAGLMARIAR